MEEPTPFQRLTWPVRTERLLLRPLRAGRRPGALRDPGDSPRWPVADRAARRLRRVRAGLLGRLRAPTTTLVMLHDGALVGDLYLAVSDAWRQREVPRDQAAARQAEIGWLRRPGVRRTGASPPRVPPSCSGLCFEDLGVRRAIGRGLRRQRRLDAGHGEDRDDGSRAAAVQDSLHRELGWVDGVDCGRPGRRVARPNRVDPADRAARVTAVTFDQITWPRRTARLAIRPATADDLRAVFDDPHPAGGRAQWMPEHARRRTTSSLLRLGELDVRRPHPRDGARRRRDRRPLPPRRGRLDPGRGRRPGRARRPRSAGASPPTTRATATSPRRRPSWCGSASRTSAYAG